MSVETLSFRKSIILLLIISVTSTAAMAQYRKSNIFTKSGRIYEMGMNYRILGGERSGSPGVYLSAGRSRGDRRIHHWFDMGINAGTKYSYMTVTEVNGNRVPVNVTGKTGMDYSINYTLGYFLADNSYEEKVLLPFVSASIGYSGRARLSDYSYTPTSVMLETAPSEELATLNAGLGAGFLYRLNEKIGIRVTGGYMTVNTSSTGYAGVYQELINHPYAQVALRFNIIGNDD